MQVTCSVPFLQLLVSPSFFSNSSYSRLDGSPLIVLDRVFDPPFPVGGFHIISSLLFGQCFSKSARCDWSECLFPFSMAFRLLAVTDASVCRWVLQDGGINEDWRGSPRRRASPSLFYTTFSLHTRVSAIPCE